MTPPRSVVIVGESVAGTTSARKLRALGHSGRITLVGAEAQGAYSRPPLSKAVVKDDSSDSTLGYRLDGQDVEILRSPAAGLDIDRRVIRTGNGQVLDYDALVIATGADARRIAALGQRGEVVLRTLDNARRLRTRLDTARSAIVIGAGFPGRRVGDRGGAVLAVGAGRASTRHPQRRGRRRTTHQCCVNIPMTQRLCATNGLLLLSPNAGSVPATSPFSRSWLDIR